MIPKLSGSQRFTEDYKRYQQRISAVTDSVLQKDLIDSLLKLKEHVQYIDRSHEQIFFTGKVPTEISDHRNDILRYKKILDTRLENWEKAHPFTPALHPNVK